MILEDFENAVAILLNAVYFKGDWAQPFEKKDTSKRSFYINNNWFNNKVEVDTMFRQDFYFYGELPELKAQFVELPYQVSFLEI